MTREQIDQRVADHEFEEQEVEIPLHAEKPVVQKRVVAKERVGVETEIETEAQAIQDEVRKERVDVDNDRARRR